MANVTIVVGAYTTVACSLAALASDATLVAGRETDYIDVSGLHAQDYLISGFFTHASTAGNRQMEIWSYANVNVSAFAASAAGAQANLDVTGKKNTLKLVDMIPIVTTAGGQLTFGPYSLSKVWGGSVPSRTGLFFVHNAGDALNASAQSHMVGFRVVNVSAS